MFRVSGLRAVNLCPAREAPRTKGLCLALYADAHLSLNSVEEFCLSA